ncbi:nucleotidyl transferase AbiEii/AbiGii toxin family protein [Aquincola sp. S2]|uniref:Nucleotidyl transferase AbiEii/AbiGii toxin family protein n=1 Tax=Pseudaquabacterium terrae TaxID=2732868 RepID=A0ABX2EK37_9BURK|nr:nucleotidyl transferase AbiEii/AbiGii toxin family protein [Aquabacterium terrae]NRF69004.1 nucleotidyl transferase AbiEii/AbiGii toxin family protein [Aquabacterium terrae]
MTRNLAASVRDRLKQHADAANEDFNLTLTRYGLERLLYRLSVSRHAPGFLLKGALLFSLWYDHPHRPTRDADLLAFGSNDIDTLVATFREICAVASEDGIVFDGPAIRGAEIRKSMGYGGVRINIPGTLAAARIALQIDIGFGDAVTPGPQDIRYPVLLADLPAPRLRAYPKHTVVAEKLHAICLLGMANTRMKDYFDLDVLLQESDFEPADLRRAIDATFQRRQTALPTGIPAGLSDAFVGDAAKQAQWKAFLEKNRLDPADFHDLVTRLRSGLQAAGVI